LNAEPAPNVLAAVTDSDVHALAGEFMNSGYRGHEYANWPIERRLDGFLRRRGLSRHADDGDVCNVIIDRIMGGFGDADRLPSTAWPD